MSTPSKKSTQICGAITATVGGLALGVILGWASPGTEALKKDDEFLIDGKVNEGAISWVGSIMTLGAALSTLVIGLVMDAIGRKLAMLAMAVGLLLSWLLMAASSSVVAYIFGRFMNGFFGASYCVLAPCYIAETVEPSLRGAMGTCFQLLLVIGILYSYIVGGLVASKSLPAFAILCGIWPAIFIALFFFKPETPYWLIMKNKPQSSVDKSYQHFRGKKFDYSIEEASTRAGIEESQESKKGSTLQKFKTRQARKAFGICMILMVGQQLSGVNAIIFYAEKIFKEANANISASVCTIILGIVQVIATGIAVSVVDRLGRKKLLIASFAIMAICLVLVGVYFTIDNEDSREKLAMMPLISICVYLFGFSIGAGPLPWAMLGEMFGSDIKGPASSFCAFTNWMLAFLVTKTYSHLNELLGVYVVFWMFALICIISLTLVVLFVLETKGKSLEQIQWELHGGHDPDDIGPDARAKQAALAAAASPTPPQEIPELPASLT